MSRPGGDRDGGPGTVTTVFIPIFLFSLLTTPKPSRYLSHLTDKKTKAPDPLDIKGGMRILEIPNTL